MTKPKRHICFMLNLGALKHLRVPPFLPGQRSQWLIVLSGHLSSMRIFPETASADAKRAILAKGLRAVGDGYVSIVLPAYLLALGYDAFEIGALMTATLLG